MSLLMTERKGAMNSSRRVRKSILFATIMSMSIVCTGCWGTVAMVAAQLVQAGIKAYADYKANEYAKEGDTTKAALVGAAGNIGGSLAGNLVGGAISSFGESAANQSASSAVDTAASSAGQETVKAGEKVVSSAVSTAMSQSDEQAKENEAQGNVSGTAEGKPEKDLAVKASKPVYSQEDVATAMSQSDEQAKENAAQSSLPTSSPKVQAVSEDKYAATPSAKTSEGRGFSDWISNAYGSTTRAISKGYGAFTSGVRKTYEGVKTVTGDVVQAGKTVGGDLIRAGTTVAKDGVGMVRGTWDRLWNGNKEVVHSGAF